MQLGLEKCSSAAQSAGPVVADHQFREGLLPTQGTVPLVLRT
jgi:hypothetical protein